MAFVVIVIVEWLEMPRYMYLRQNIFTESTSEGEVMEIEVKKERIRSDRETRVWLLAVGAKALFKRRSFQLRE
jgi:hypothetical protein